MMVIIDTNVIYSGLKSKRGASYKLLDFLGKGEIHYGISNALLFEYEDVLKRNQALLKLTDVKLNNFLDGLATLGEPFTSKFLWRPFLKDPKDDHILELAVVARAQTIISYNKSDFKGSDQFGVTILDPKEYLLERKLI